MVFAECPAVFAGHFWFLSICSIKLQNTQRRNAGPDTEHNFVASIDEGIWPWISQIFKTV